MICVGKKASGEPGFTLVEFLVALAILAMVSTVVAGVVFAAQAGTKAAQQRGDKTEQLRAALNQIGDDVSMGQWCCTSTAPSGDTVLITAWQIPSTDRTGWDSSWGSWPGYLGATRSVLIQYRLEGDQLVRIVYDGWNYNWNPAKSSSSMAYVRQVLARGLNPYTSTGDSTGSYFQVDNTQHVIRVVLRTNGTGTGVNGIAEVSARWYISPQ